MIETNYFNIYNASAGTGKTFSLVRDYLVLLFNSRNNELYKNILAITFTNKAVNEMKGRIVKYLINYSNCVDLDKKMIIEIKKKTGEKELAFFDAIAPIVYFESINMDIAWFQSRYDKGEGKDYINCPMNKSQYVAFVQALNAGEKMLFREWEKNTPYFNGCMPYGKKIRHISMVACL